MKCAKPRNAAPDGYNGWFVVLRPEFRYDYNSMSRLFESKHDTLTVASDLIVP